MFNYFLIFFFIDNIFLCRKKTSHCVPAVWLAARQKSQPNTIRNKIINDIHSFGWHGTQTTISMVLLVLEITSLLSDH
jgi:hypothetical protein